MAASRVRPVGFISAPWRPVVIEEPMNSVPTTGTEIGGAQVEGAVLVAVAGEDDEIVDLACGAAPRTALRCIGNGSVGRETLGAVVHHAAVTTVRFPSYRGGLTIEERSDGGEETRVRSGVP